MKKTIVVKIGGVASENLSSAFFEQVKTWKKKNYNVIIVHGGGLFISNMMEKLSIPVTKRNGLRVTTPEALAVTRMVLIGQVQPEITTALSDHGFSAVGLNAASDHLLSAKLKNKEMYGLVGEISRVNSRLLTELLKNDHIPVIAPLGLADDGQWLNVNADEVACRVAEAVEANELYLLTDVPGVKKQGTLLKEITPAEIGSLKQAKVVVGGMIPKLDSAIEALCGGVQAIHITDTIVREGTVIKEEVLV